MQTLNIHIKQYSDQIDIYITISTSVWRPFISCIMSQTNFIKSEMLVTKIMLPRRGMLPRHLKRLKKCINWVCNSKERSKNIAGLIFEVWIKTQPPNTHNKIFHILTMLFHNINENLMIQGFSSTALFWTYLWALTCQVSTNTIFLMWPWRMRIVPNFKILPWTAKLFSKPKF